MADGLELYRWLRVISYAVAGVIGERDRVSALRRMLERDLPEYRKTLQVKQSMVHGTEQLIQLLKELEQQKANDGTFNGTSARETSHFMHKLIMQGIAFATLEKQNIRLVLKSIVAITAAQLELTED